MSRRTLTALVLAYLVPGGGHLFLGRRARAAAFFLIVAGMFAAGVALHGRLYALDHARAFDSLKAIAAMGAGIPYAIGRLAGTLGDYTSSTFEYGSAFIVTAGLMNMLLVLDVFDIGEGRKR